MIAELPLAKGEAPSVTMAENGEGPEETHEPLSPESAIGGASFIDPQGAQKAHAEAAEEHESRIPSTDEGGDSSQDAEGDPDSHVSAGAAILAELTVAPESEGLIREESQSQAGENFDKDVHA